MAGSLATGCWLSTGVMAIQGWKHYFRTSDRAEEELQPSARRPPVPNLFFICLFPLEPASHALPAPPVVVRGLRKRDGRRPEGNLAGVGAGHLADLKRVTFRTAVDFFDISFLFVLSTRALGTIREKVVEDFQSAHELSVGHLQAYAPQRHAHVPVHGVHVLVAKEC